MRKPRVLLTNDDGIDAPGIFHLWNSLKDHVDLYVVAPHKEQSASGCKITPWEPLHVEKVEWQEKSNAWAVSGTPADCVRMGVSVILEQKPDLIISGINRGANSGRVVLYSGTIGGVIEGVLRGIPGIAFSLVEFENPCFKHIEEHIPKIVDYVLDSPLPKGTLLNVNFPQDEIKGIRLARQGKSYWIEDPKSVSHPDGKKLYNQGMKRVEFEDEHDHSDITLLRAGYATAVPIHIQDLTDHDAFSEHQDQFNRHFTSEVSPSL